MTNPEKFGFRMKSSDMYNEYSYTKVKVDSTIVDLSEFALQNGSNFHEIKTLNPWLIKKNLLVGEGQSYEIYFPNTVVE